MRNNRFAKGSGVYVCKSCGHRTRKTGDGAQVGCCELCYEIGGYENQMSDNPVGSMLYLEAEIMIAELNERLLERNSKKG